MFLSSLVSYKTNGDQDWSKVCGEIFLPFLSIDGVASIILLFLLYGDARSRNFSCLAPFILPPYAKYHLNIATFALADYENRTRAASASSDRAIRYNDISLIWGK